MSWVKRPSQQTSGTMPWDAYDEYSLVPEPMSHITAPPYSVTAQPASQVTTPPPPTPYSMAAQTWTRPPPPLIQHGTLIRESTGPTPLLGGSSGTSTSQHEMPGVLRPPLQGAGLAISTGNRMTAAASFPSHQGQSVTQQGLHIVPHPSRIQSQQIQNQKRQQMKQQMQQQIQQQQIRQQQMRLQQQLQQQQVQQSMPQQHIPRHQMPQQQQMPQQPFQTHIPPRQVRPRRASGTLLESLVMQANAQNRTAHQYPVHHGQPTTQLQQQLQQQQQQQQNRMSPSENVYRTGNMMGSYQQHEQYAHQLVMPDARSDAVISRIQNMPERAAMESVYVRGQQPRNTNARSFPHSMSAGVHAVQQTPTQIGGQSMSIRVTTQPMTTTQNIPMLGQEPRPSDVGPQSMPVGRVPQPIPLYEAQQTMPASLPETSAQIRSIFSIPRDRVNVQRHWLLNPASDDASSSEANTAHLTSISDTNIESALSVAKANTETQIPQNSGHGVLPTKGVRSRHNSGMADNIKTNPPSNISDPCIPSTDSSATSGGSHQSAGPDSHKQIPQLIDSNMTAINDPNKTVVNETVVNDPNKTVVNETVVNETVVNVVNETVVNETVVNETVVNDPNKTVVNELNRTDINLNEKKIHDGDTNTGAAGHSLCSDKELSCSQPGGSFGLDKLLDKLNELSQFKDSPMDENEDYENLISGHEDLLSTLDDTNEHIGFINRSAPDSLNISRATTDVTNKTRVESTQTGSIPVVYVHQTQPSYMPVDNVQHTQVDSMPATQLEHTNTDSTKTNLESAQTHWKKNMKKTATALTVTESSNNDEDTQAETGSDTLHSSEKRRCFERSDDEHDEDYLPQSKKPKSGPARGRGHGGSRGQGATKGRSSTSASVGGSRVRGSGRDRRRGRGRGRGAIQSVLNLEDLSKVKENMNQLNSNQEEVVDQHFIVSAEVFRAVLGNQNGDACSSQGTSTVSSDTEKVAAVDAGGDSKTTISQSTVLASNLEETPGKHQLDKTKSIEQDENLRETENIQKNIVNDVKVQAAGESSGQSGHTGIISVPVVEKLETEKVESGVDKKTDDVKLINDNHVHINDTDFLKVRFHGHVVLQLTTPKGTFFIMKEVRRRCLKPSSHKEQEQLMTLKQKNLNIPFKELAPSLFKYVSNDLVKRNVLKKVPVKNFGIISVTDATALYHAYRGQKVCINRNRPCVELLSTDSCIEEQRRLQISDVSKPTTETHTKHTVFSPISTESNTSNTTISPFASPTKRPPKKSKTVVHSGVDSSQKSERNIFAIDFHEADTSPDNHKKKATKGSASKGKTPSSKSEVIILIDSDSDEYGSDETIAYVDGVPHTSFDDTFPYTNESSHKSPVGKHTNGSDTGIKPTVTEHSESVHGVNDNQNAANKDVIVIDDSKDSDNLMEGSGETDDSAVIQQSEVENSLSGVVSAVRQCSINDNNKTTTQIDCANKGIEPAAVVASTSTSDNDTADHRQRNADRTGRASELARAGIDILEAEDAEADPLDILEGEDEDELLVNEGQKRLDHLIQMANEATDEADVAYVLCVIEDVNRPLDQLEKFYMNSEDHNLKIMEDQQDAVERERTRQEEIKKAKEKLLEWANPFQASLAKMSEEERREALAEAEAEQAEAEAEQAATQDLLDFMEQQNEVELAKARVMPTSLT